MNTAFSKLALSLTIGILPFHTQAAETETIKQQWQYNETLNDNIIAVGIPLQNTENFDDAIVLMGEKRAYLLQYDGFPNPQTQFTQTDSPYLRLSPANQRHRDIGDRYIEILSSNTSSLRIKITFDKPAAAFQNAAAKAQEMQKMRDLGFQCMDDEHNHSGSLYCFDYSNLSLQTVQTAPEKPLLHRLDKPIAIKFAYHESEHTAITHAQLPSLNPNAVIQVQTLPIQTAIDEEQ